MQKTQNTMNNEQRNKWIVIGVSGVTCGGKTTLAKKLTTALTPVYVFNQDQYFYPDDSPKHVKCDGIEHNNYDILSSLDMERMYKDVISTMNGVDKSHYRNTERAPGSLEVKGRKFLVVEGFTVLNYKPILELCHLMYYLVLERGACVARRARRVYEPPDVPGYFERCVWPEHCKYRDEISKIKTIQMIDGERSDTFELVIQQLKEMGARSVDR